MKIGSHVSISGGLLGAAEEAFSYGANALMIYTGAPQNTIRTPIEEMKIEEGWRFMKEHNLEDVVVHAPYIINLASYKDSTFNLAKSVLKTELDRTKLIGSEYLILHPGAYTDTSLEFGVNRIAEGLNSILDEDSPIICLETMTGKGTEIGRSFEELASIIEKTEKNHKLAVCIDTCHLHDAGYDIVSDFDGVLDSFDRILGIDLIKIVHINGSLNKPGSRKDRHANIGAIADNPKGADYIGFDAINRIVHSKRLTGRIFILETPWLDKNTNLYKEEIAALRGDGVDRT